MTIPRRSLPLLLVPFFLRGQAASLDADWSRFIQWYEAPHPEISGGPPGVLAAYQKKLMDDGMPREAAETVISRLRKRADTDPEFMRINFNRIYTNAQSQEGSRTTEPNAFLAETITGLSPGKALDLGMGMGRNSIFLARHWN